ncbi:hypothetical protein AB0J86_37390 [Micromonospora sp. NPDC049559]|uniref:hypothetical protein n=1 Tax=Micromonospora sp. NPDC049559 TaxID=3155923 RepID=UPI003433DC19
MTGIQILLVVALIGWTIARRMLGQPLRQRRLVLVPLIFLAWGGYLLTLARPTGAGLGLLAAELAVALGVGLLRGATIHVYVRDGHLWMRYRWSTLGLWLASAFVRLGFVAWASTLGTGLASTPSLLLGLGATFLGEGLVVASRAGALGAPFAPARTR